MSGKTPDLGTAWRLLDEARAELDKAHERTAELVSELNRVTAERDDLSARLADAVSPTARDYDNAAEILKLRGLVAKILDALDEDPVHGGTVRQWRREMAEIEAGS